MWSKYINLLKPIRQTPKVVLMLLAVLIVTLTSIGIVKAITTKNSHNRGVIIFAGDSNISYASSFINANLTNNSPHYNNSYAPVLLARVGSAIRTPDCLDPTGCTTYNYWQQKLGETLTKIQPDAVVSDLGINDTTQLGTASTQGYSYYGLKIDWFMKLMPAVKYVFWTNLPCNIEPPSRLTGCNTVNTALSNARNRWPNLIVLDWATAANSHPEYMSEPVGANNGAVHYSAYGYAAWSGLVVNALDSKFPVPNN